MPLQGLFFLNSDLIQRQAAALLTRLGPESASGEDSAARIQRAYGLLFQRQPTQQEIQRGLEFLKKAEILYRSAAAEPLKVRSARAHSGDSAQEARRRRRRQPRSPAGSSLARRQDDSVATVRPGIIELWRVLLRELGIRRGGTMIHRPACHPSRGAMR